MSYIGRKGATAPLASADIPENSITENHLVDNYDDVIQTNIALLAFKTAVNGSLAKYNLQDQVIDEYTNATGIDDTPSTNHLLAGGAYSGNTVLLGEAISATGGASGGTAGQGGAGGTGTGGAAQGTGGTGSAGVSGAASTGGAGSSTAGSGAVGAGGGGGGSGADKGGIGGAGNAGSYTGGGGGGGYGYDGAGGGSGTEAAGGTGYKDVVVVLLGHTLEMMVLVKVEVAQPMVLVIKVLGLQAV